MKSLTIPLTIFLLFGFRLVYSQSNESKKNLEYVIPGIYLKPQVGGQLELDLRSSEIPFSYGVTPFQIEAIYDPAGKPISSISWIYQSVARPETELSVDGNKLRLQFNSNVDPGDYKIVFADQKMNKHIRLLKLKEGKPEINKVTILTTPPQVNELLVDPSQDWTQLEFHFDFGNDQTHFEKVSFQGLELKKVSKNVYKTTPEWTSNKLKDIKLGQSFIEFKRLFEGSSHKQSISLKGKKPKITGPQSIPVGKGFASITITLEAENIYKDSFIEVLNGDDSDLFEVGKNFNVKISENYRQMTFDLQLKKDIDLLQIPVRLMIHNRDGSTSDSFELNLSVTSDLVETSQAFTNFPIITGIGSDLRFKISKTKIFDNSDNLWLDVSDTIYKVDVIDFSNHEIVGRVSFKDHVKSSQTFLLRNGDNNWKGVLPTIVPQPRLQSKLENVYNNSTYRLNLLPANEHVKVEIQTTLEKAEMSDSDFSDSSGLLEIGDFTTENESLQLNFKIGEVVFNSINPQVLLRDNPMNYVDIPLMGSSIQSKIGINSDDNLVIESKSDVDPSIIKDISIQLLKSDGSGLGERTKLRYNVDKGKYDATLRPGRKYGITGGSNFGVQLFNGEQEGDVIKGYVKRKWQNRIIINVGLSAMVRYFKAQAELTPIDTVIVNGMSRTVNDTSYTKTFLLNGLNFGIFYSPELWQVEGKRPLALGVNLIGFEASNDVKLNLAVSTLIYETIAVGYMFQKGAPGWFIGANVTLLDFSKLFKGGG